MKASYHYRWLALVLVAGCATAERGTPAVTPAVVPTANGLPVADAVGAMQAAGLRPALEAGSPSPTPVAVTDCPDATVLSQDTPPGAELVRGSTVVLRVASCTALSPPSG